MAKINPNNETLNNTILLSEKHERLRFFHFNLFPLKDIILCITNPEFDYAAEKRIFNKFHALEYIEQGLGEFVTKNETINVHAGQTLFIRKNTTYSLRSKPGTPFKKICVLFSCYYLDEMIEEFRIQTGSYLIDAVSSFQTFYTVFDLQTSNKIAYIIENSLHKILMHISAQWHPTNNEFVSDIKNKLESTLYTKCNLDAIADELGITKSAMIKAFKKNYGVTPYQFLLNLKMDFAKEYLISSSLSIKSIALLFSFTDEHYFSYIFTKKNNISPSEYRKKFSSHPLSFDKSP